MNLAPEIMRHETNNSCQTQMVWCVNSREVRCVNQLMTRMRPPLLADRSMRSGPLPERWCSSMNLMGQHTQRPNKKEGKNKRSESPRAPHAIQRLLASSQPDFVRVPSALGLPPQQAPGATREPSTGHLPYESPLCFLLLTQLTLDLETRDQP